MFLAPTIYRFSCFLLSFYANGTYKCGVVPFVELKLKGGKKKKSPTARWDCSASVLEGQSAGLRNNFAVFVQNTSSSSSSSPLYLYTLQLVATSKMVPVQMVP